MLVLPDPEIDETLHWPLQCSVGKDGILADFPCEFLQYSILDFHPQEILFVSSSTSNFSVASSQVFLWLHFGLLAGSKYVVGRPQIPQACMGRRPIQTPRTRLRIGAMSTYTCYGIQISGFESAPSME